MLKLATAMPLEFRLVESVFEEAEAMLMLENILYRELGLKAPDNADEDFFFVAIEQGHVKGAARLCLNYNPLWKIAYFRGVAVPQKYQQQGIGRQLYLQRKRFALERGKTRGIALIREAAISLYESEGYTVVDTKITPTQKGPLVRYWVVNDSL